MSFIAFMGILWSILLFTYSKMAVLDCLKPSTLSNGDRMLWNKFFVVCKCPGGAGHYQLPNARPPGLIVQQMPGVCPGGGMLAAGIDSHITQQMNLIHTQFPVISCNTEAIGLRAPKNHKFSVRKFYFFFGQTRFGICLFSFCIEFFVYMFVECFCFCFIIYLKNFIILYIQGAIVIKLSIKSEAWFHSESRLLLFCWWWYQQVSSDQVRRRYLENGKKRQDFE